MKRSIAVAVFLVLLVGGVLAGVKALQLRTLMAGAAAGGPPPETVSSVVVREENWPETLTAIGSLTAVQGVNVTAELSGMVREIAFQSGAVVAKGDLLVRLDTATEEAQLRATQAQVDLDFVNLNRVRNLRAEKMVSESDLNAAEAAWKQNVAHADAIRATMEKKTLRAPFAGRLGIRLINLGQYLETGKAIVSLQALTPVYAEFSLPQQELARLKTEMRVRLTIDAYPGRVFEGELTAMNPDLDPATRSVGLQATFANSDLALRPGMFARVEVLLAEQRAALVVPATSILSAPYGDSVYVLEPKPDPEGKPGLVVRQQFVRAGRARGDLVSVETGLKAGNAL
jgi:membrane fusion protein (multidrug efflux system)